MSLNGAEVALPAGQQVVKSSPLSELRKPRSNSSGSNSSSGSSNGKKNDKKLSPITLSIEWKEDMDDSEESDEALRTSLHCFDDLYQSLTMSMTFRQVDLTTGKFVLNMQLERTVKSFLQFYKAYCKFHNFPNSLRLEEEIQSHPMAGRAVGDGVDHEQLKMSIIEKIKVFFQSIIAIHGGFFWDDQSIIDFIDEDLEREFSSESMLTLRVDAAHSEVHALESNVEYWRYLINSAQSRITKLSQRLRGNSTNSTNFPSFNLAALQSAAAAVLGTKKGNPEYDESSGNPMSQMNENKNKTEFDRGTLAMSIPDPSITSEVTVDMRECMYETSFLMNNSFDSNFLDSNRGTENSAMTSSFSAPFQQGAIRPSINAYNFQIKPSLSSVGPGSILPLRATEHREVSFADQPTTISKSESSVCFDNIPHIISPQPSQNAPSSIGKTVLPVSQQLPCELLHIVLNDLVYESAVDEVVEIASFTTRQFHSNRFSFFMKHFQTSPTTKLFDIGLHAIDFGLFDDEIKVSFVGDASVSTAEGNEFQSVDQCVTNALRPYSSTKKNKETMVRDEFIGDHSIGFNPQLQTKPNVFVGTLDGLPFAFHFQEHVEACLLLMFDEINTLVGKNDLVKRTVRLIRAWWMQESITYVGVSIKQYLTNSAFLLMISVIFNKYHSLLQTPFQAFCFFFAEFSTWNPCTQLVTIDGLVDPAEPREAITNNNQAHLFDDQFILKYRRMLHLPPTLSDEMDNVTTTAVLNEIGVYIVNPLNGANLIVDKMSANQVARFPKAFQGGATNLSVFLKQLIVTEEEKAKGNKSSVLRNPELINNYFPNILTNFAERVEELQSQNKDSNKANTTTSDRKKQLHQCVAYGNLVNSGCVEKESVLFVVSGLLQNGGAKRSSEIVNYCIDRIMSPSARDNPSFGKILTNFIAILREGLGDGNFVVVDDNPADPFIIAKDGFTQNQLNLITRGLVSPQAIVEMQKANANLKQEINSFSDTHSIASHGSFDSIPSSAQLSLSQRNSGSGSRRSLNPPNTQQQVPNNNNINSNNQRNSYQHTPGNSQVGGGRNSGSNFQQLHSNSTSNNNHSNNANANNQSNNNFNNNNSNMNGNNNNNNRSFYQNNNFHNNNNYHQHSNGNFGGNNNNNNNHHMQDSNNSFQPHNGNQRHTFSGFQGNSQNFMSFDDNNGGGNGHFNQQQQQRNSFGNTRGGGNPGRMMGNRGGRYGNNQQGGRGYNGGRYAHNQQQNFQGGNQYNNNNNGNRNNSSNNNTSSDSNNGGSNEMLQMQHSSWLEGF